MKFSILAATALVAFTISASSQAISQTSDCRFWESNRYTAWTRVTAAEVKSCLASGIDANEMTPKGHPVVVAADQSDLDVLDALLKGGGNPNAADGDKTALAASIKDINADAHLRIKALLDAGAKLTSDEATELLRRAASFGNVETIDILITRGGDPFSRKNTNSLLHLSVRNYSNLDVTAHLLSIGLPPDARGKAMGDTNENGYTPLMGAAWAARVEMVASLISAGANINAASTFNSTPLHRSLMISKGREARHEEIAKMLISKGANVDARDNNNVTPLHLAAINRSVAGVEMLLDANADASLKDGFEKTAWDYIADTVESTEFSPEMRRILWQLHDAQFFKLNGP